MKVTEGDIVEEGTQSTSEFIGKQQIVEDKEKTAELPRIVLKKISLKKNELIQYKEDDDDRKSVKVLSCAGTVKGVNKQWFNVEDDDH